MVQEIIRAQGNRVVLRSVLKALIRNDEEVVGCEHCLGAGDPEHVVRNENRAPGHLHAVRIEGRRQRHDVHGRLKLGRREKNQVLRIRERVQVRRIIRCGREPHIPRARDNAPQCRLGIGLGGRLLDDIRHLNLEEPTIIIVLAEKRARRQELIVLIRRLRRVHDIREQLRQTIRLIEEGPAQLRVINGDRIVLLAIHRMELTGDVNPVRPEDLTLEIIALRRIRAGLDDIGLHLLDSVSEIEHPPLEGRQRIRPRDIPDDDTADTIDERVEELVPLRRVFVERRDRLGDPRLGRRRNPPLILARPRNADRVKNLRIRLRANNTLIPCHYLLSSSFSSSSSA